MLLKRLDKPLISTASLNVLSTKQVNTSQHSLLLSLVNTLYLDVCHWLQS
ncbi:MAG: hypothetical protein RLZZ158_933 [Cyanobacteriota bacterium]